MSSELEDKENKERNLLVGPAIDSRFLAKDYPYDTLGRNLHDWKSSSKQDPLDTSAKKAAGTKGVAVHTQAQQHSKAPKKKRSMSTRAHKFIDDEAGVGRVKDIEEEEKIAEEENRAEEEGLVGVDNIEEDENAVE